MPTAHSYAPPTGDWGGWTQVYQRIRLDDQPQTIHITYSPVGDVNVFGEVKYNSPTGYKEEGCSSGTNITLGAGLGSWVEMRFRTGIFLGTAVSITIEE